MQVNHVSKAQAIEIFRSYGLPVGLLEQGRWRNSCLHGADHDGVVCDYTELADFTVAYACQVVHFVGTFGDWYQVERFNVMK